MDLDAHLTVVVLIGIFDGIGMHLTVFQLHAVGNLLQILHGDVLIEEHVIHLLLQELRMGELAGQLTVVGKQQHTGGVAVETAHGIDALGAGTLNDVHHGLTLLRVIARRDAVLGFIEQDIHLLLNRYRLTLELHLVGALHLGAEFGHHLAVDGHLALCDIVIGLAA